MKILILGATGMLGHILFKVLLERGFDVYGTARTVPDCCQNMQTRFIGGVDALDISTVLAVLDKLKPTVVINAVGLIRHLPEGRESLPCISINAAFPHILLQACLERGIRLIHYSTDCVFDGKAGRPYTESDLPTAVDIYGLTKFLGEVKDSGALTLRTSIIGPELRGKHSLLEWFLAQKNSVRGFTKAIYSGMPTTEHARILAEYVLPRPQLKGLYHLAASPISKYELLSLLAKVYRKDIAIIPDDSVWDDKRLSPASFQAETGYIVPCWEEMLITMRQGYL